MDILDYARPIIQAYPKKVKVCVIKRKDVIYAGNVGSMPAEICILRVKDVKLGTDNTIMIYI